jgi:hypothetical protein
LSNGQSPPVDTVAAIYAAICDFPSPGVAGDEAHLASVKPVIQEPSYLFGLYIAGADYLDAANFGGAVQTVMCFGHFSSPHL